METDDLKQENQESIKNEIIIISNKKISNSDNTNNITTDYTKKNKKNELENDDIYNIQNIDINSIIKILEQNSKISLNKEQLCEIIIQIIAIK